MAGALLLTAIAGCASTGSPAGTRGGPHGGELAAWTIPAEAYPTQRLFRFHAESAEDEGRLRLVLRLESPDRYRLGISDRLGRSLFTVDVRGRQGWLLDHREGRACRLTAGTALHGIPLEPLAPEALPALLLGRVPAAPAGAVAEEPGGGLSYRDSAGRRWSVVRRGGSTVGWTRWKGGEPDLWWQRANGEFLLSDRGRGLQMRWRQVATEPLSEPLPSPEPPPGFARGDCAPEETPAPGGV